MNNFHKKERGFTLVEILIVLALLGILIAVVVPNLTGFLGRGKEEAYGTDSRTMQAAVDGYYTDTSIECGGGFVGRCYPTFGGNAGNPWFPASGGTPRVYQTTNYYINTDALVTTNYLREVPQSASDENSALPSRGSYNWFVSANGVVSSTLNDDPAELGYYDGTYP